MTRQDGEQRPRVPVFAHDDPRTIEAARGLEEAIRSLPLDQQRIYGEMSPDVVALRRRFGQSGANPAALDRVLGNIRTEQADEVNPIE
jgi:hypothetical protein